ncbi:MAG: molybdopterin-guanine dinucleotide biosynthesis protein A [Proteobacteria bacterium]|nr:molybdopterin-guanine dinucleotide biosynthesis protein A [Pseudomonadota bacterium]
MRSMMGAWIFVTGLVVLGISPALSQETSNDRYIGYYYPAPEEVETYCARVPNLPNMDKRRRIGFIIGIRQGMNEKPFESSYSVFAKGEDSTKLIIVARRDGYLSTIYRARALLADLTTSARTTPIFEESGAAENLTFLDLLTLLGFETITVSDGDKFSHQFQLQLDYDSDCQQDDQKQNLNQ